jgi:hypothetical protein
MTERTITEDQLKEALLTVGLLNTVVGDALQQKAFPPPFTPKKGEAIWASDYGNQYRLRVFSHMDEGAYVCFENSNEDNTYSYTFAKPQTPTQKGE